MGSGALANKPICREATKARKVAQPASAALKAKSEAAPSCAQCVAHMTIVPWSLRVDVRRAAAAQPDGVCLPIDDKVRDVGELKEPISVKANLDQCPT
jgi:hypothetical protein